MDRNIVIGFVLIAAMMFTWSYLSQPDPVQLKRYKEYQDSLARAKYLEDSTAQAKLSDAKMVVSDTTLPDSAKKALVTQQLSGQFGAFAAAAQGEEKLVTLENDKIKVTLSSKGGRVLGVELKGYLGYATDTSKMATEQVKLMADKQSSFSYFLPVEGAQQSVNTNDLYFAVEQGAKQVTFRAFAGEGKYFEQTYSLNDGTNAIDYTIRLVGLQDVIWKGASSFYLNWVDFPMSQEKYSANERTMTTVNWRESGESPTYCSCTGNDNDDIGRPVEWVAHTQQFFSTALIARSENFQRVRNATENMPATPGDRHLKKLTTEAFIGYGRQADETHTMQLYFGTNDYNTLRSFGNGLEDVIHYGWSFFGSINKWMVRPMFNLLSSVVPSMGLCIILLTLLVKLLVFPLQYRILHSGVKMQLLRPLLGDLKKKHADDQARFAQEQMKLFREYGVNPLGGCLPSLIQTPIWIALYRFFSASLDFRQEGFLWANDLVAYDDLIPFPILGHISLFTLLWVVSMIVYAWYSSSLMDPSMQTNPGMKYMPYIFPIMFFFVLNSSASGLTCYMLFSNIFNIGLTILTKNVLIDENKLRAQMEINRGKPKKASILERLEEIQKQQEARKKIVEEQKNLGTKKKK